MKNKIHYIYLIAFLFIGFSAVSAQENAVELTPKQKALLQAQKEQLKKNRAVFIASLTEAQINIIKSKRLSQVEQKRALLASLTDRQKLILARNQEALKRRTDAFRSTLSPQQKQRLRHLLNVRNSLLDRELVRERIQDLRRR